MRGEVFRHMQLVEVARTCRTRDSVFGPFQALDEDGNLAECPFCGSLLLVHQLAPEDSLFPIGRVVFSKGVMQLFGMAPDERTAERQNMMYVTTGRWIDCHRRAEWGSLPAEDAASNRRAMRVGANGQAEGMVMSIWFYNGEKVWMITERGRNATTVALPREV